MNAGSSNPLAVPGLRVEGYERHALHGEGAVWTEKNCYIDVWIELVHALGLEPRAMLSVALSMHFDDDQWTFVKPAHTDLFELYGIDVQELNVWRPLHDHALDYLGKGRLISTEADAFWLPDTAGTDYRRKHTKSTIILAEIDPLARSLAYFHNGGYYALSGDDYAATFGLGVERASDFMPLFAESVRVDRLKHLSGSALRDLSSMHLRRELARRPDRNPVIDFERYWRASLPQMQERGIDYYHAWAFANLRQLGAVSELSARYFEWLLGETDGERRELVDLHDHVSVACKAMILKGARAVNGSKPLDWAPLEGMRLAWDRATELLISWRDRSR